MKKEKFLEFARSIVAFNIIATAACVNKLSIFSKGSNYVYPTYLPVNLFVNDAIEFH